MLILSVCINCGLSDRQIDRWRLQCKARAKLWTNDDANRFDASLLFQLLFSNFRVQHTLIFLVRLHNDINMGFVSSCVVWSMLFKCTDALKSSPNAHIKLDWFQFIHHVSTRTIHTSWNQTQSKISSNNIIS